VLFFAQFNTNGICAKNSTHMYVARTSNNRVITACDLYCCFLVSGVLTGVCQE